MNGTEQAKRKILELCSEDDFGSWELYWDTAPLLNGGMGPETETAFIEIVQSLVKDRKISPKRKNPATGDLDQVPFDASILAAEIKNSLKPDPELFFWFGEHEGKL